MKPSLAGMANMICYLIDKYRAESNYEVADKFRECLTSSGIRVQTTKTGTRWYFGV